MQEAYFLEFLTTKVFIISFLILTIHSIETLAYATRLSGARVGFIASALSLFNIMVIVSRSANMIQQPFTGGLVDSVTVDGVRVEGALALVENQFRVIIGASTLGTIVGMLLLPTFIAIFSRAILHLREERGSIPLLVRKRFKLEYIKRAMKHVKAPKLSTLKEINVKVISWRFFALNMLITSIYTIGVLSALYAALLAPERAATAIMASGLINGIATILLVIFVDPKISVLADEVRNKEGNYLHLRDVTGMMILSRLLGTIFAQILFIPGAHYVAWFTQFII